MTSTLLRYLKAHRGEDSVEGAAADGEGRVLGGVPRRRCQLDLVRRGNRAVRGRAHAYRRGGHRLPRRRGEGAPARGNPVATLLPLTRFAGGHLRAPCGHGDEVQHRHRARADRGRPPACDAHRQSPTWLHAPSPALRLDAARRSARVSGRGPVRRQVRWQGLHEACRLPPRRHRRAGDPRSTGAAPRRWPTAREWRRFRWRWAPRSGSRARSWPT
jgi:hypothetical protein